MRRTELEVGRLHAYWGNSRVYNGPQPAMVVMDTPMRLWRDSESRLHLTQPRRHESTGTWPSVGIPVLTWPRHSEPPAVAVQAARNWHMWASLEPGDDLVEARPEGWSLLVVQPRQLDPSFTETVRERAAEQARVAAEQAAATKAKEERFARQDEYKRQLTALTAQLRIGLESGEDTYMWPIPLSALAEVLTLAQEGKRARAQR